jgi:hypothetical protein
MPNVTISLDDDLLKRGRDFARSQNLSFNAFVRELIDQRTRKQNEWLYDMFKHADNLKARSDDTSWTRDELYRY